MLNKFVPDSVNERVECPAHLAENCWKYRDGLRETLGLEEHGPHRHDGVRRPRDKPQQEQASHHLGQRSFHLFKKESSLSEECFARNVFRWH